MKFVVDLFQIDFHLRVKIDYKIPKELLSLSKRQLFLEKNKLEDFQALQA
jgi:hypothetical protein